MNQVVERITQILSEKGIRIRFSDGVIKQDKDVIVSHVLDVYYLEFFHRLQKSGSCLHVVILPFLMHRYLLYFEEHIDPINTVKYYTFFSSGNDIDTWGFKFFDKSDPLEIDLIRCRASDMNQKN